MAVATAAKHGIVVILNTINAIKPAAVIPVDCIIAVTASTPPSASTSIAAPTKQAASVPNVEITFSLAIKPEIAATMNTQPVLPSWLPNPSGVNIGCSNLPNPARIDASTLNSS